MLSFLMVVCGGVLSVYTFSVVAFWNYAFTTYMDGFSEIHMHKSTHTYINMNVQIYAYTHIMCVYGCKCGVNVNVFIYMHKRSNTTHILTHVITNIVVLYIDAQVEVVYGCIPTIF